MVGVGGIPQHLTGPHQQVSRAAPEVDTDRFELVGCQLGCHLLGVVEALAFLGWGRPGLPVLAGAGS